jgi:glycolate oxidase iron-sulfur subunit
MAGGRPPDAGAAVDRSRLALSPLAEEQLRTCVHCGFCLPVCPTYRELGEEPDSPRGRIWQMGAAARGELDAGAADLRLHLDLCLDCRACETACPSGVGYGAIVESARAALFRPTRLWSLVMRRLWMRPGWFGHLAGALALAQRLGLLRLARAVPGLPAALRAMAPALPPLRGRASRQSLPQRVPPRVAVRGRAAVLLGCVADALFPGDNEAMVGVLTAGGLEVEVPPQQGCCGSLHYHQGDLETARELARRNVAAFAGTEGPVVVNAAGCGAVMKHYDRLLPDDPAASAFAARVRDFSEVAAGLDLPPPRSLGYARVVWHDPCHLSHGQGIRRQPRDLLRAVPGLDVVELQDADSCCGSAGLYNVLQWEMSSAVLERKMETVAAARADWVVTGNPGCLLQLRCGALRAGTAVRVRSLCDVLGEAYAHGDGGTAGGL